ncbi:MAG: nitroreductase family protein, partial [Clostridia bacterium]|nr:nitroreductase family protein [Clostridia bacterium]
MSDMTFEELIRTRQATRGYDEKPVEREKLQKIVEEARLAPSACNSQPWKAYIVTGGEKLATVVKSVQDLFMNKFASTAPAFIVVADKQATLKPGAERKFDRNHFVAYDVGQFVAYLTLAAKNEGLETCVIGWVNQETLKTAIPFAEDERCNLVISVGYS